MAYNHEKPRMWKRNQVRNGINQLTCYIAFGKSVYHGSLSKNDTSPEDENVEGYANSCIHLQIMISHQKNILQK
jgi:hypothetical protein